MNGEKRVFDIALPDYSAFIVVINYLTDKILFELTTLLL